MYSKRNYNNQNKENKTKEMFEKIVTSVQFIVNNGDYEKFLKKDRNFIQISIYLSQKL